MSDEMETSASNDMTGKLIIGIDLGTTNSGVAFWNENHQHAEMLEDEQRRQLLPSLVGWYEQNEQGEQEGRWVTGYEARAIVQRNPEQVVHSIKRYIGRRFHEIPDQERSSLSYHLVPEREYGELMVNFTPDKPGTGKTAKLLTASGISAKILARLRQIAASALQKPVEEIVYAVITVPAYFDYHQRRATQSAGLEAGFKNIHLLTEPTAAALAFREDVPWEREQRILVYDLGGGTFDVSLLEVSHDARGYGCFTLAVDGDTHLGGDDIDTHIVRLIKQHIKSAYKCTIEEESSITKETLRAEAERAKIEFSKPDINEITISLSQIEVRDRTPIDVTVQLTAAQIEECALPIINRTIEICQRLVKEAAAFVGSDFSWHSIDTVLLVGGQTLMPLVQRKVREVFGKEPHVTDKPFLSVALGAAEFAHTLYAGEEHFEQNALTEVIALPLGICLDGEKFQPLIFSNQTLPTRSKPYSVTTTVDSQLTIRVEILQGSRDATHKSQCSLLGNLDMDVAPAVAGRPEYQVVFEVTDKGKLEVTVTDCASGQKVTREISEVGTYRIDQTPRGKRSNQR